MVWRQAANFTFCEAVSLTSKYRKHLVGLSIGIGLGLFLMSGMSPSFLDEPLERVGFAAIALGILWFLIERKKIGFGRVASILTMVLVPIATIPLFLILVFTMGPLGLATFIDGLALLFAGSGSFAVGLIGVYIDRKPKSLGLFFTVLGMLFLLGTPLANGYQVIATRWGNWVATPYRGYTIPLILVGLAFFLLAGVSILHVKPLARRQSAEVTRSIEQGNPQPVSAARNAAFIKAGFICLILSSMSLIGAAVALAPNGPSPLIWGIMGLPVDSQFDPLSLVILSISLFLLGPIFVLHEKSKGRGFFTALLGSFGLMFAAFANGYKILALEKVEAGEYYFSYVNPLREFTLPIVVASVVFLAFGYRFVLSKVALRSDGKNSLELTLPIS